MGLFGPTIPSVYDDEETHVVALGKNLKLPAPEAKNQFDGFLTSIERLFVKKVITQKYGPQAGPRYLRSYQQMATMKGSPIHDDAYQVLEREANQPDLGQFQTRGHGIRWQVISSVLVEWFGNRSEADAWFRPYLKSFVKDHAK